MVEEDGRIKVTLMAPPQDGKANESLTRLISDALGLSKRAVRLIFGEKSREKGIEVVGLNHDEAIRLLSQSAARKR